MKEYLKGNNVRLRCKKSYPGAHTHIIIGRVEEENGSYIVIRGRTFHFNRISEGQRSQINSGITMLRAIPWENVEIINLIGQKTDWEADFEFDRNGNLVLQDKLKTIIAEKRDGIA